MNNVLHRNDTAAFRLKTVSDHVAAEGQRISTKLESASIEILEVNGIPADFTEINNNNDLPSAISNDNLPSDQKPNAVFRDVIDRFNESRSAEMQIKDVALIDQTEIDPIKCVYISIDDVGVDQQKDSRKDDIKSGQVVENTVIHIQHNDSSYVITAVGMRRAFQMLLAFLLSNDLIRNHQIMFFSDGARNIRKSIKTFFSFCPHTLMLDWYHLEKRMTELLSMALKGSKDERSQIRETLDGILWAGNVDDAIAYLQNLPAANIKNSYKLNDAVAYLNRKKADIPCYAIRKLLGYRNSSNPAEKANDLIVADRQKHNGMSWSPIGSGSLAVISAAVINNELSDWVTNHEIPFKFNDSCDALAA